MKVVQNSYDLLIIEDRPWIFGIFMIMFTLLLAWVSMDALSEGRRFPGIASGLSALLLICLFPLFIRRSMLSFNRSAGTVTLTKRSTREQTTQSFALDDLNAAEVLTSTNNEGDEYHSVRLSIGTRSIPFTDTASSGDGAMEMAATINDWLQLDSPTPAA